MSQRGQRARGVTSGTGAEVVGIPLTQRLAFFRGATPPAPAGTQRRRNRAATNAGIATAPASNAAVAARAAIGTGIETAVRGIGAVIPGPAQIARGTAVVAAPFVGAEAAETMGVRAGEAARTVQTAVTGTIDLGRCAAAVDWYLSQSDTPDRFTRGLRRSPVMMRADLVHACHKLYTHIQAPATAVNGAQTRLAAAQGATAGAAAANAAAAAAVRPPVPAPAAAAAAAPTGFFTRVGRAIIPRRFFTYRQLGSPNTRKTRRQRLRRHR
jgi:hypothetical protein